MDIQKAYIAKKYFRRLNKTKGRRNKTLKNRKTKRRYGMHQMDIQKTYIAKKL